MPQNRKVSYVSIIPQIYSSTMFNLRIVRDIDFAEPKITKIAKRSDPTMKILVPIKRVIDYNVKIRVKEDQSGVELSNVKMSINPFDEIAVEEAVRLKEANKASEVIVVAIGPEKAQEQIRTAMAIGADRGILVQTDSPVDLGGVEPLIKAKTLKEIVDRESPNLVIIGKQAIDDDSNQTGQMLAALLGWPQGAFTSKLEAKGSTIEVVREIDGGLETLKLNMPAVITADLNLNKPRYAKLPNIIKAKNKPIEIIDPAELGISYDNPRLEIIKVTEPPAREDGVMLNNIDELIDVIKDKIKAI